MNTFHEFRGAKLAAGLITCISILAEALLFAPMAQASSSTKEGRIGAVILLLQAEEGCSNISGSVGNRRVSLNYSEMWGYGGRVGRASIDADYTDFLGYFGTVGRDRVELDYTDFLGYFGTVGRDNVRITYNDTFGFSGSVGSQRVSLSCN